MQSRFRGRVGGISPFFAFQDIITSAMAVIITIVMLLALNMGKQGGTSPDEPASADLSTRLRSLLDELSQAGASLRTAQEAGVAANLDPATLKNEIGAMRQELAALQGASRKAAGTLSDAQRNEGASIVWGELEKQKAVIAAATKSLAQREEEAARTLAEMKRIEAEVRAAEAQLLAERARKNELWLIPDKSKTSKEPVLAIVSAEAIVLQRFDQPDKTELRGHDLVSSFRKALTGFAKLDQYIVFYFKPSGVDHFEKLTDLTKNAGFEIGYDTVGEEMAINFRPAP